MVLGTHLHSLVPQDENTRRRGFMIARPAFESLFNAMQIPICFLVVMANNNGGYQVSTTYSHGGAALSFRESSVSSASVIMPQLADEIET